MDNIKLNVYNENGEITKEVEAKMIDLEFGTIRSLMELMSIETIEDTSSLMFILYDAWDEITSVLNMIFPEMDHDDWEHVKLKELIPMLIEIMKYSFSEILTLPKSKNV